MYHFIFYLLDVPIWTRTTHHVFPKDASSGKRALKLPFTHMTDCRIHMYNYCLFKPRKRISERILHFFCFCERKGYPHPHLTELSEKSRIRVHSLCILVFIASKYSCKTNKHGSHSDDGAVVLLLHDTLFYFTLSVYYTYCKSFFVHVWCNT